jgi:predicted Fe-Mo cluster-binding NifX family protein
MKIAIITDDGKTISSHFGRAAYYMVVTIEGGKLADHEMREKLGHNHFSNEPHPSHDEGQPHGFDVASQNRHLRMAEAIKDCEAVICKGMGRGAYESMLSLNIRPWVTDITDIDEAARAYADGQLVDHLEKLH